MRLVLFPPAPKFPLFMLAFLIFLSLATSPAFAGPQAVENDRRATTESLAMETLRLKEATSLSAIAPNAFGTETKCDSGGDIFLQIAQYDPSRPGVQVEPIVSEIVPESKQLLTYGSSPLSPSEYPNLRVESFSVTPRGTVYALLLTRPDASGGGPRPTPSYYIERFKDDGTMDSISHISPPPGTGHWFADLLGAFSDGYLIIAGSSNAIADQSAASSWRPFTAIYDPHGRFIREVALPDDVTNEPPETQTSSAKPSKPREYFEVAISTGGLLVDPTATSGYSGQAIPCDFMPLTQPEK